MKQQVRLCWSCGEVVDEIPSDREFYDEELCINCKIQNADLDKDPYSQYENYRELDFNK